ncbi:hypothetical protein V1512DRAFT_290426 [Lipomyces arxii]|uniref:uncharacterized protein n=1 Tax=Lipomyces arxii TaxID=56418 RepID=UPI0034CDD5EC
MFLSADIRNQMLLYKRDDVDQVIDKGVSFGKSFRSWDTCMANTGCKVIAIVGIVLASILVFSLITWILRIIWCGAEATCWLCSRCCSSSARRSGSKRQSAPVNVYNIPQQQPYYMGPPAGQDRGISGNYTPAPIYNPGRKSYAHLKDEEIEMGRVSRPRY